MRRILVQVSEDGAGWTVSYDGLAPQARMRALDLQGTWVPVTPDDRTPDGDDLHTRLCRGDDPELPGLLRRVNTGNTESGDVRAYGRWLFECLLAPAWDALLVLLRQEREVEIALSWPAEDRHLNRLVWEAMWVDTKPLVAHHVGLVAITRVVPIQLSEVQMIAGVPKVLFATSVDVSDPVIRPGAMFMGMLRWFDSKGRCRTRVLQRASTGKLSAACAKFQPDVVHLVAHGTVTHDGRGVLKLPSDAGPGEQDVDATALSTALLAGERLPMAVILSSCHTASSAEPDAGPPLAAQLVAAGVPMVSAMSGEVSEAACRLYTRRFADALHEGQPVVLASAHGRRAALYGDDAPCENIGWALPALFLAASVDTSAQVVDANYAKQFLSRVDGLDLAREPVFIGRQNILDKVEEAVGEDAAKRVVAVIAQGSTEPLGGTRLLREIGWRLLRDGHIPVLLGQFGEGDRTLTTAAGLVHGLLHQLLTVAEKLGLPPFIPMTLDLPEERIAAIEGKADIELRLKAIRADLSAFRDNPGALDPGSIRGLLAKDCDTLARLVQSLGAPFRPDCRVVVLCDKVNEWVDVTAPANGLDFMLDMLDPNGLGKAARPVPVVLTGTINDGRYGGRLEEWRRSSIGGRAYIEFGDLTLEEAVLGYQWVLLHPWEEPPADGGDKFRQVYTSGTDGPAKWQDALAGLSRRPTIVKGLLYDSVWFASNGGGLCTSSDDDEVWRTYAQQNLGRTP